MTKNRNSVRRDGSLARSIAGLASWATFALAATQAFAFDTGHHSDLTREALSDLGFSDTAIQVAQVENWLVDYYSNREAGVDDAIKIDCDKLHSDNLFDEASVKNYWDRFSVNAKAAFTEAARRKNPREVLALLGISLHAVQDFYSHSNWAELHEPPAGAPFDYVTLTYFDARSRSGVKTGQASSNHTPGQTPHGGYDTGMNHDWYGKRNWDRAYVHAYAGSRQWSNQARLWVSAVDPVVWEQAKQIALSDHQRAKLSQDHNAAYRISEWVKSGNEDGHWKGKGSGNLPAFLAFSSHWITLTTDSDFVEDFKNRSWHRLLSGGLRGSLDLGVNQPPPSPAPSIAILPIHKVAVVLTTYSVDDLDAADPIHGDGADFYAKVSIHNQQFIESVQNGHDHLKPPWITMKFLDAGTPFTAIHYELWDEDTTSSDEHLDIEPRNGVTNLDFAYNLGAQRSAGINIDGRFIDPQHLLVSRGTPGNHAEVKLYIATRTLGPAPRPNLPPVANPNANTGASPGPTNSP